MVIVVFAGFFIVFYDSTTSIFPIRVSQLVNLSALPLLPPTDCPPIESLISDVSNPMRIIAMSHW